MRLIKSRAALNALRILSAVTIVLLTMIIAPIVSAVSEDFSTYTEVDPNNRITKTSDNVTWAVIRRNEVAQVYKDMGAAYFDESFCHSFELKFNISGSGAEGVLWLLSNAVDSGKNHSIAAKHDCIGLYYVHTASPNQLNVKLFQTYDDNFLDYSGAAFSFGTSTRYVTIVRDEAAGGNGTLTAYYYTDAERTDLVTSQAINLQAKQDYRYIYAVNSYNGTSGDAYTSGYIRDLDLASVYPPTGETLPVVSVDYNDTFSWWDAVLCGNVTSDGGEGCTAGFFYREKDVGDFMWAGASGTYNSGENFTASALALENEKTYEYKSYVQNSAGYDIGDLVEFNTNFAAGNATVLTYNYPIELNNELMRAQLYGKIVLDGGSNCTALFRYRVKDAGEWVFTANTTDLISGDNFSSYTAGNLTLAQYYQFEAVAINDSGTAYGGIGEFVIYGDLYSPIMTTDNVTGLTNNRAWLHGTCVDDGDGDNTSQAWGYFQYRKLGTTSWQTTPYKILDSGDNYSQLITNLTANTNYQWRAVGKNAVLPAYQADPGYGEIKVFSTYEYAQPPIIVTDNSTWLSTTSVRLKGHVSYDGGYPVTVWFEYKPSIGDTGWQQTTTAAGAVTDDEYIQLVFNLAEETWYDWRAAGSNEYGTSYGTAKEFYTGLTSADNGTAPGSTETGTVGGFAAVLTGWMAALNMDNPSGHWAFMFLLMFIPALIFGIALIATHERIIRIAYVVILLILELAIFGGFLFSGLLGIWAVVILIFVAVGLIVIFGGRLLTHGRA